jgi:hypothetical protein
MARDETSDGGRGSISRRPVLRTGAVTGAAAGSLAVTGVAAASQAGAAQASEAQASGTHGRTSPAGDLILHNGQSH